MHERTVTVAILIEYRVEGDASVSNVGSTAVAIGIPALPTFHVGRTICTPTAVGILRADEGPVSEQFGFHGEPQ
jgi:hypothetical protein